MELLVTLGRLIRKRFIFLQMSCKASLVAKMEYHHGHNLQAIFKKCKVIMVASMVIHPFLFRCF